MAGRIRILLIFFVSAMAVSINGDVDFEEESYPYTVTMSSESLRSSFNKYMANTPKNLENLIKTNPSLGRLMNKAKGLLQMRLIQWADVISQVALIDIQLRKYVALVVDDTEDLANYAQWIVSHDHGAISGLMEEMRKVVMPLFTDQGIFKLAQALMSMYNHQSRYCGCKQDIPPRARM